MLKLVILGLTCCSPSRLHHWLVYVPRYFSKGLMEKWLLTPGLVWHNCKSTSLLLCLYGNGFILQENVLAKASKVTYKFLKSKHTNAYKYFSPLLQNNNNIIFSLWFIFVTNYLTIQHSCSSQYSELTIANLVVCFWHSSYKVLSALHDIWNWSPCVKHTLCSGLYCVHAPVGNHWMSEPRKSKVTHGATEAMRIVLQRMSQQLLSHLARARG